jgi:hypothetical protein
VNVKNAGDADFSAATNGFLLEVQGQIVTGEDGRARLDYSNENTTRLGPNTSMTIESTEQQTGGLLTTIKLEAGRIWIALKGGSIDVETPSGLASVRGSNLMVWVDPATLNVYVSCFEGDCGAENSASSLNLTTGYGTVLYHVESGNNPPPPESYQLTWQDFQDWAANNPDVQNILPSIIQTLTAIPTLSFTPTLTATATVTSTSTPTATVQTCFTLAAPANGTALLADGVVTFAWSPMAGAEKYAITFTDSFGTWYRRSDIKINTYQFEIGSLYSGGMYTWKVDAYDAAGKLLCTAPEFTFIKPVSPTPTFTPLPTPTGNTIFTFIATPSGSVTCGSFTPYFEVNVADPDGVSSVIVSYYPSASQPGSFSLYFNEVNWASDMIPLFYPGTVVNWQYVATDGLGNVENSAQFQFTCQ